MPGALIEIQYFPCVAYFACWDNFDGMTLEGEENFQKQSYRNRCYINGPNKVQALSVPVVHEKINIPIREMKIDNSKPWKREHWQSIQTSYGNAPFFEYYEFYFKDLLSGDYDLLWDLNHDILTKCLELTGLKKIERVSENYLKIVPDGITDLRNALHPKKQIFPDILFQASPYYQVFGKDFVENLSIIDLIFCEGPRAKSIISDSLRH